MGLTDEIDRLHKLRQSGALTDAEFSAAKRRLIDSPPATRGEEAGQESADQIGRAANRYVSFEREKAKWGLAWGAVVLVVFLIIVFTVFLPRINRMDRQFDTFPGLPNGVRFTPGR